MKNWKSGKTVFSHSKTGCVLQNLKKNDYVSGFLKKMDEFNLDDYIRAIHFDQFQNP